MNFTAAFRIACLLVAVVCITLWAKDGDRWVLAAGLYAMWFHLLTAPEERSA